VTDVSRNKVVLFVDKNNIIIIFFIKYIVVILLVLEKIKILY